MWLACPSMLGEMLCLEFGFWCFDCLLLILRAFGGLVDLLCFGDWQLGLVSR